MSNRLNRRVLRLMIGSKYSQSSLVFHQTFASCCWRRLKRAAGWMLYGRTGAAWGDVLVLCRRLRRRNVRVTCDTSSFYQKWPTFELLKQDIFLQTQEHVTGSAAVVNGGLTKMPDIKMTDMKYNRLKIDYITTRCAIISYTTTEHKSQQQDKLYNMHYVQGGPKKTGPVWALITHRWLFIERRVSVWYVKSFEML